jgi:ABC-type sugar transport system ATPase subunit
VAGEDPSAAFKGAVAIVEHLGNSTILYVDTPAGQLIVEGEGNLSIKSGEHVGLALAVRQAHLFDAEGVVV